MHSIINIIYNIATYEITTYAEVVEKRMKWTALIIKIRDFKMKIVENQNSHAGEQNGNHWDA